MNRTFYRVVRIAILIPLAIAAGCQTVPSHESGMGKISTDSVIGLTNIDNHGPVWHGVVISIKDDSGTEVYSIFKKGPFQYSAELPAGNYEILHTCSPSQADYEKSPAQWRFTKWTTKLRLNSGDLIKFVAEGGLTLSGVMCQGKFFVPRGQLLQANRVVP